METLFGDRAVASRLIGPGTRQGLDAFVGERVVNLSPDEFGGRKRALADVAGDDVRIYPYSDGLLIISDTVGIQPAFARLRDRYIA